MDSQLLVCASVIGEDLYKRLTKNTPSQKALVRASRAGVLIIASFGLIIASRHQESILEAVFYAWGGLGSAFGPLVLMSLYDKKSNKYGAISGMLIGGIIGSSWPMINPYIMEYVLPATIPGFSLGLLCIFGVSRLTNHRVSA